MKQLNQYNRRSRIACAVFGALMASALFPSALSAASLRVGPNSTYQKPCQAILAARSGDVCGWRTDDLTIRGVGGRAKIDAAGRNAQGKGIWVISGQGNVVESIEFSGASVPDRNGAGIRLEGSSLVVRNCYFHDNENGILGGIGTNGEVLIEYSEFANNGYGDGYSHNIYIKHVGRLIVRYCYSRDAKIGHLLKSRAAENYILYNRLSTEAAGRSSMEIDIPNGGGAYIIGNVIYQGPRGENNALLTYATEAAHPDNPREDLHVVNNTFVNRRSTGRFIVVGSRITVPAEVKNNIFTGTGTVINQAAAVLAGNYTGEAGFENESAYDFRLAPSSPAIDAGVDPGSHNGFSLTPDHHYVHPVLSEDRVTQRIIDIGAYEYGGGVDEPEPPAAPVLAGLTLGASSVEGGKTVSGNSVVLDAPAPAGGAVVALSSSSPSAAVPASVTVPQGQTTASFTITTSTVSQPVNVTIRASYAGTIKSAALLVEPPPPPPVKLVSLQLAASQIAANQALGGNRVVINTPAPAGGVTVKLASSRAAFLSLPASVTIPAGQTAAEFTITAANRPRSTNVRISATLGNVTLQKTIQFVATSTTVTWTLVTGTP